MYCIIYWRNVFRNISSQNDFKKVVVKSCETFAKQFDHLISTTYSVVKKDWYFETIQKYVLQ